MAAVRLIGFEAGEAAALAEALAGFGYSAAGGESALAVIANGAPGEAFPGFGETPLIVLAEPAAAAGGSPAAHRLARPLRLGALLALLRRLERRRAAEAPGESVGPYRFHAAERLLLHEQTGEIVRLTDKEAALLAALAAAAGATVARETLLENVWGYGAAVTTHTLETHVYRLRQKLGGDEAAARLLAQEADGYRLAAR
jgi:hypothetical protein